MAEPFLVESPNVTYSKDFIEAKYTYSTVHVCKENGVTKVGEGSGGPGGARLVPAVRPCSTRFTFRTGRQVPRLGVMLVGWGGNNGTTVTAAVLANRLGLSWMTKTGRKVGVPSKPGVGVPPVSPLQGACAQRDPHKGGVPKEIPGRWVGVSPVSLQQGGCPQRCPSKGDVPSLIPARGVSPAGSPQEACPHCDPSLEGVPRVTSVAWRGGCPQCDPCEDPVPGLSWDLGTPSSAALVSCTPNLLSAPVEGLCSPCPPLGGAPSSPVPSQTANYYGSLLQASTVCLGTGPSGDVYVPFRDLLPMVGHGGDPPAARGAPSAWVTPCPPGWDISSLNLAEAMRRAEEQLWPHMEKMKPRPSIYIPEFIAANQEERADNVLRGSMAEQGRGHGPRGGDTELTRPPPVPQVEQIRRDIRDFKESSGVDKVIVLWTANTERFCDIVPGLNDTADNLLRAIEREGGSAAAVALSPSVSPQRGLEVSPSTLFAVASVLEGCAYINGSPQNTFVPGAVELAAQRRVFIGGDDFKSGQTKLKSVLVDFLVGAGLKVRGGSTGGWSDLPTPPAQTKSIVSYNHLGNNDGKNLSAPQQFRSKEISKSNVVDDTVQANPSGGPGGSRTHTGVTLGVVIKYVPYVGDSKRALDEYTSEIMMGGTNTIVIHNTCEVRAGPPGCPR
ncbi:hypothetical protein DV515_00019246, partial [Chloebia gouldiae]